MYLLYAQPGFVDNNVNGTRRGFMNVTMDGINVQNTNTNLGLLGFPTNLSAVLFPSLDRLCGHQQ